jgi:hypothetical protein
VTDSMMKATGLCIADKISQPNLTKHSFHFSFQSLVTMEASSATINNLTNQLANVNALDARADPRMCKSCATIFSNTHASRLVLRNTVSIRRRYQSLLDTKESGCRLCRLLVAIVDLQPVELKDGRLVPAGEEKEEDEARSEDVVESLFAVDGEELHNIRITCKIENKRERFAFVEVSAHKGIRHPSTHRETEADQRR